MHPFVHQFRSFACVEPGPMCSVHVFEELQMDLHFAEDQPE